MTTPAKTQPQTDPGKGLAVAGIILAFLIPLVGLILSIIGLSKSKKAGHKNTLGVVGIILNATFIFLQVVFVLVMVLSVPALQRNARNTQAKNDLALVNLSVQEYSSENGGYYPSSLADVNDISTLTSVEDGKVTYTPRPAGCIAACIGYTLSVDLEGNAPAYTIDSND